MLYSCDIIELKKVLAEKRIDTILELSKISNINRNTLSSVLSGSTNPSSQVMYKLVESLHLTPERAGKIFFKLNLRNM